MTVRCAARHIQRTIKLATINAKEDWMNAKPATYSRKSGIVTAIGIVVLLLGTATGNAYAMLAMAVVALVMIAALYREELGRNAWLAMVLALTAGTAAAIALAIAGF
jgi:hypothetical protein